LGWLYILIEISSK